MCEQGLRVHAYMQVCVEGYMATLGVILTKGHSFETGSFFGLELAS